MNNEDQGELKPQDLDLSRSKSRLEDVQERLYSPNSNFNIRPRRDLSDMQREAKVGWEPEKHEEPLVKPVSTKKKLSWVGWTVIAASIFFVGAVAYGAFVFFNGLSSVSGKDVDVSIVGPVSIGGGERMSIDVVVSNNNNVNIKDVNIAVTLPPGTREVDSPDEITRLTESVGEVGANTVVKKTFDFILFGEEGDNKNIDAIVDYKVDSSNATFERKEQFPIILQSSPVRIKVNSVKEITANQDLIFEVELTSNSTTTLENILVTVDYPFGFTFIRSSIPSLKNNNVWLIDELQPKGTTTFTILGQIEGQNEEERVFKFSTGLADEDIQDEIGVLFSTIPQSITISRPFFGLDLSIGGDSKPIVVRSSKGSVGAQVSFKNNTQNTIKNAEVEVKIEGAVLNQSSVLTNSGFYDSNQGKIIWNNRYTDILNSIGPGQTIELSFSFSSKPLAQGTTVFKNPEVTLNGSIKGVRVSETGVDEQIESVVFRRVHFESDLELDTNILYGSGPFTNTGPRPPKVGQETTYTVNFALSNSSNAIENGRLTAVLPDHVRWKNNVYPSSESVSFDEFSRTIEWNIGDIDEHAGFLTPKKELSFQVSIVPSIFQIGNVPELLQNVSLTGLDTFVNKTLDISDESVGAIVTGTTNNSVVE